MTARQPRLGRCRWCFRRTISLPIFRSSGMSGRPFVFLSLSEADRGAIAEALRRVGLAGKEASAARTVGRRAAARGACPRWCATGRCFCSTSLRLARTGATQRHARSGSRPARGTAHDGAVRHPPARRRAPHRQDMVFWTGHGCRDRRRVRFFAGSGPEAFRRYIGSGPPALDHEMLPGS